MLTATCLHGFSCPQERLDEGLLETVAVEYSRQYVRLFVERYEGLLQERSRGLSGFLADWLDDEAGYDTVWDPAFGAVHRAVIDNKQTGIPKCAAALGLRLLEIGREGDWEIYLESPTRLRWGRWLLPPADWIGISMSAGGISAETRCQGRVDRAVFVRAGTTWEADGAQELPTVETCGIRIILMLPAAFDNPQSDKSQFVFSEESPETGVAALGGAIKLLDKHAPAYLPWVSRAIRYVVPIRSSPSMLSSASDKDNPGMTEISTGGGAAALAEMLVHEAAHQHYYLLLRLGPVDDGSDKKLYYSPIKDTGRPIDRILLAYHAFANVLLFYRLCRNTGLEDDLYFKSNEENLIPQLEQLESALRTTGSLTQSGRALWEPLAERMHRRHGWKY